MTSASGDDTRILNMRINNKEFLKGTSDSLKAVNTLNDGINNATKSKGFQSMGANVDTVKTKFGALQIAGVTALATLTNKVVGAGLVLAKSLAIDPIVQGFQEYQKVLTATQTIAANTNNRSSAGIAKVTKALQELNHYSDKTIYSFTQMADNAGRFTAAGVNLKDATVAIKGMSNAAALAGATNEQLGTAMYQVSQALGTDVIRLQDWNSLANANLGTKNMRDALLDTAHAMGDAGVRADAAIAKFGSFRDSLRSGWLEGKVFTQTMKVFAGQQTITGRYVAYTVKQLKGFGYSTEAAKRLHELSAASIESATKIKTFSQLMDTVKEAIGSGWSQIFQDLFGNLQESSKIWTKAGDVINQVLTVIFGGIDNMLQKWKQLGGFGEAWATIGNIFKTVGNILHPFIVLLDAITPGSGSAGTALYGFTHIIYLASVAMEKATSVLRNMEPVFNFIGKVIGYPIAKIKEFIGWLKQFDYAVAPLGPAFDRFGAAIKKAFDALFKGNFSGFGKQIRDAFKDLYKEAEFVGHNLVEGLKAGINASSIEDAIKNLVDRVINFFKGLLGIHSPSTVFAGFGGNIVQGLSQGISSDNSITGSIGSLVDGIVKKFKGIDKFDLANAFSLLFSAATIVFIVKFTKAVFQMFHVFTTFGNNVNNVLKETANSLQALQFGVKAKAIKDIAIAVGILAAALWVLSNIPGDKLAKGLGAVTILLTELTLAIKVLANNGTKDVDKVTGKQGFFAKMKDALSNAVDTTQLVLMAGAMVLMATALLILAAAVAAFGLMPTGVLVKGMTSITIALAIMSAAAFVLGKAAPSMILASGGILILSIALAALAPVIFLFSKIKWSTLFSGLLKMGVALVLLAVAMVPLSLIAPEMLLVSAALIILSVGLTALLGVITLFATVEWGTIIQGSLKIAAALVILGLAAAIAAPGLIALGVAAVLLGAGLLAAGIGLTLIGAGVAVLAAAGTAAFAVLISGIESFISVLPFMGIQFIAAIDTILQAAAEKAPSIVDSIVKITSEILRGMRELAPKMAETAVVILTSFLDALTKHQKDIFDWAIGMILGFLDVIEKHVKDVVKKGVRIAAKFIEGLGQNANKLVDTAGQTILDFLTALDNAVNKYSRRIGALGVQIGEDMAKGVVSGILGAGIIGKVTDYLKNGGSGGSNKNSNKNGGNNSSKNSNKNSPRRSSATSVGPVVSLDDASARRSGASFAANIAAGLVAGTEANQRAVNAAMANLGDGMSQTFADVLQIRSPSRIFRLYAQYVAQGFVDGLLASTASVQKAATTLGKSAILGISKTVSDAQIKLESLRGLATAISAAIESLQKKSDDPDTSAKKKAKIDKEIEDLQKQEEAAKEAADAQEKLVEKQNAAAEKEQEFKDADLQGKADIRKDQAAQAAQDASEARERALALKQEANLIRKFQPNLAAKLDKESQAALAESKKYADQANDYAKQAKDLATQAKLAIDAEAAKSVQTVTAADVANAQSSFETYLKLVAEAEAAASKDHLPGQVTFEQNNYSPEAISPAEAYRNGKSLVSIMERKLTDAP